MSQRYHKVNQERFVTIRVKVRLNELSNHDGFSEEQIESAITQFNEKIAEHLFEKISGNHEQEDFLSHVDFVDYDVEPVRPPAITPAIKSKCIESDMLLSPVQIKEVQATAATMSEANEFLRKGQAFFIALYSLHESIARAIAETENDPYYDDLRIVNCLAVISKKDAD